MFCKRFNTIKTPFYQVDTEFQSQKAAIVGENAFMESKYIILSQNTFSAYVNLYLYQRILLKNYRKTTK